MKNLLLTLFAAIGSVIAMMFAVLAAMNHLKSLLTTKPEDIALMKTRWQSIKMRNKNACLTLNTFFETNSYFRASAAILSISFILLNVMLGAIESNLLILNGNENVFKILTPPVLRVASSLPLAYLILPKRINKLDLRNCQESLV